MIDNNIFETRASIEKVLTLRGEEFIRTAHEAIKELSKEGVDLIPDFISGYYGFDIEVREYDDSDWVDNPEYNPNLTAEQHRENYDKGIKSGFHQTCLTTKMVQVTANEIQDSYDDWTGDPDVWRQNVPLELFLNGTSEEIKQFFVDKNKEEIERENRNAINAKWSTLFNYNIEDIKKIQEISELPEFYNDGFFHWKNFDEAVTILEGEKNES